jgi:hypothetical protein
MIDLVVITSEARDLLLVSLASFHCPSEISALDRTLVKIFTKRPPQRFS